MKIFLVFLKNKHCLHWAAIFLRGKMATIQELGEVGDQLASLLSETGQNQLLASEKALSKIRWNNRKIELEIREETVEPQVMDNQNIFCQLLR